MSTTRPLDGIRVVDLSRYLPGPLVSRILGDLGARVLKIEEPKLGDPSRNATQRASDGQSALATLLLSGHESIALDLKKKTALSCLEDLLMDADVLVESFRPGTLARLGLPPEELRRRYPKLVICSVSGWGQDGPHAGRAGHDVGYLATAGTLAASPHMPATQIADVLGGWSGASAVLAALYKRNESGEGSWIDQSLLDAAGYAAITAWAAEADGPRDVGEPLMLTGRLPCYKLYKTADDGYLALAALEPHFWQRFCRAVGRSDLILKQQSTDPAVHAEVAAIIARKSRSEWSEFMDEHDIPAEPVLSLAEAQEHPQVRHRELVQQGPDDLPRLGFPALFDGERPRGAAAFPQIGEQTEALVNEFQLAHGISRIQRKRAGIGRRLSIKRWLYKVSRRVVRT